MVLKQFKNSKDVVYATVSYDAESNCVMDTWEGFFGSQDNFRSVVLYVAEVIAEKKAVKWLADLSKMNGSFDGSKDWLVSEIMPKVIQSGLLYEAIVLPKNVFSKLSARDTITKIKDFELRQFDDINQAKSWLNESAEAMIN